MGNQYSIPATKAGFTKTPLAGDQEPLLGDPNQNGGQNLSTIVTCTTSNGIFLSLDVLFWTVWTCLTVCVYCTMPFPGYSPFMYDPECIPGYIPTGIYITLCWFSVLFETLATKKKHKIMQIFNLFLTAILFSLSVFISLVLSTTTLIDFSQSNNFMYGLYLAFFARIHQKS